MAAALLGFFEYTCDMAQDSDRTDLPIHSMAANRAKGKRQRMEEAAQAILIEEYEIRSSVSHIPLHERDLIADRLGKKRQVFDFLLCLK